MAGLRYGKIIVASDSTPWSKLAMVSVLTFFHKYMSDLIGNDTVMALECSTSGMYLTGASSPEDVIFGGKRVLASIDGDDAAMSAPKAEACEDPEEAPDDQQDSVQENEPNAAEQSE